MEVERWSVICSNHLLSNFPSWVRSRPSVAFSAEMALRRLLKLRYLGLISLERTVVRQRSSIHWKDQDEGWIRSTKVYCNKTNLAINQFISCLNQGWVWQFSRNRVLQRRLTCTIVAILNLVQADGFFETLVSDKWINCCDIQLLAPNLWVVVPARVRNLHTVRDGLLADRCGARDISGAWTVRVFVQYIRIWDLIQDWTVTQWWTNGQIPISLSI